MKTVYYRLLLLSLFALTTRHPARAQVAGDMERRYKSAVRLVQIGDYDRARAELNALSQREGSIAPYATYYLAVMAFRQKNYSQARIMLKQLADRFPNWQKRDDAYYLFGCVATEMGQYEEVFTQLQRIADLDLKANTDKLERYVLARITEISRLKAIQKEFPDNRNIALTLIDRIQRSSTDKDDLELSDKLTNKFGVPAAVVASRSNPIAAPITTEPARVTTVKATPQRTKNKGYYNVAIMFPFKIDDFDAERRGRANQYVYDLYAGIRLAKTKLQDEGISINLFAYDIDNEASKTAELLESPAFAQNDLIIGPLYAEPNRLVTAFAGPRGIPVVNPISTNSDLILNQPMTFLAQPSLVQQAEKMAGFVRTLPQTRRAAVYFGTSRKDSLLGLACQNALKKQGVQVADWRKMAPSAEATAAMMTLSEVNKPGYVLLTSSNEEDGPRLLEALGRRNINSPIVATSAAFDTYRNSLSTFTRRELYLLSPDFIDPTRPEVVAFNDMFLMKQNIIPSVYASQGYDMMLFFGRLLAKNALQARSRIDLKSDSTDYVLSGFDYTQSNDNQIVPIIKFDGGRFIKVNE